MITWCMMMVVMLAVPAGVLYIYKVSYARKLARAVGRMLVFLGLTAGGVQLVLSYSHWLVAAGWLLLMVGVSVLMVLHTSRLSWKDFMVPVAAGVCTAVVLAGLLTALAMSNMLEVWNAGFLIPVAGMLTAGLVTCCGKGLSTYYMGLRHHGKLYDYLLANGASHSEALAYFTHRALERALLPCLSMMGGVVISSAPALMWGMVVAGVPVLTAVAMEVALLLAALCCSVISVVVTLFVVRRFAFDSYLRIKG